MVLGNQLASRQYDINLCHLTFIRSKKIYEAVLHYEIMKQYTSCFQIHTTGFLIMGLIILVIDTSLFNLWFKEMATHADFHFSKCSLLQTNVLQTRKGICNQFINTA